MKRLMGSVMAVACVWSSATASVLAPREFQIEGFARVRRIQYFFGHNISVASFVGAKIAGQTRFARARCVASTLNLMFFEPVNASKDSTPRVALTEHLRFETGSDVECDLLASAFYERRETNAVVRVTDAGISIR